MKLKHTSTRILEFLPICGRLRQRVEAGKRVVSLKKRPIGSSLIVLRSECNTAQSGGRSKQKMRQSHTRRGANGHTGELRSNAHFWRTQANCFKLMKHH